MLQMLKSFSKEGRLLEIVLHGKKETKMNGYAVGFHWDDLDDYVIFHNTETNRKNRVLVEKIKTVIRLISYGQQRM